MCVCVCVCAHVDVGGCFYRLQQYPYKAAGDGPVGPLFCRPKDFFNDCLPGIDIINTKVNQ